MLRVLRRVPVASISFLLLASFQVSELAQAQAVHWSTAEGGNGNLYEYVRTRLNFPQVLAASESRSVLGVTGRLATISSAPENELLRTLAFGSDAGNAWIGLVQAPGSAEPDGGFQWINGEPVTYTNWSPGEPNDAGGIEHFTLLYDNGYWNDIDAAFDPTGYFVEYETNAKFFSRVVNLDLAPQSFVSISLLQNGQQVGGAFSQPAFGQMSARVLLTGDNQPVGLSISSFNGIAQDVHAPFDLGAAGTIDLSLLGAGLSLQAENSNTYLLADDLHDIDLQSATARFPSGEIRFQTTGDLAGSIGSGSIFLGGTRGFVGSLFSETVGDLTAMPTLDPSQQMLSLDVPLVVDLPLSSEFVGRFTIHLHAMGKFEAVPEPSTWALGLLGLASLGIAARRRKR